jgi:hypothetical protein
MRFRSKIRSALNWEFLAGAELMSAIAKLAEGREVIDA